MAKRDVDCVDPANASREIPESIQLAERWRVAGVKLRKAAPEIFEKLLVTLATCALSEDDDVIQNIPESYLDA